MCGYVDASVGALGSQKKALGLLELVQLVIMSQLKWPLEIEFGFSAIYTAEISLVPIQYSYSIVLNIPENKHT